ncbi:MAG: hypothetical protein KatS3mg042_0797 [Rhodothermaceae bacterium]|nr:MAG: hypothetical protein KatS3mg042_0797 [Rhodothermaceae bacterium]
MTHRSGPPSRADQAADAAARLIDLTFLEAHAFGNPGFVARMIDLFLGQAPALLASLQTHLEPPDLEQIRFVAHKLKSSARMMGSEALTQVLEQVEQHARHQRVEETVGLARRAVALGEAAIEELKQTRPSYGS